MAIRPVRRRGVFRARVTRDGETRRRDGDVVVMVNELPNHDGSSSLEMMFEDGIWMLAEHEDLDTSGAEGVGRPSLNRETVDNHGRSAMFRILSG